MSASIGRDLPEKLRKDYFKRKFKKGAVLKQFTKLTTKPKLKRFVIWGTDKEGGLTGISFLNTDIHPGSFYSQKLRDAQLFLKSEGRKYLKRNSYLDCSSIYEMDFEELKEKMIENPAIFLGNMSNEDFSRARKKIIAAKTIEPRLKKRYGFVR